MIVNPTTTGTAPIHATDDMDTADLFLGERGAHMYNFRSLFESGTLMADLRTVLRA